MLVHPQFDPVAIAIGPVQIHWYGLTYLVAFGLFLWLGARRVHGRRTDASGPIVADAHRAIKGGEGLGSGV